MTSREFPLTAGSVRAAREFVAELLPDVDGEIVNPIRLMVSELAANCVRHAGTPFRVTFERSDDHVRIEVTDTGPGSPSMRLAGPQADSGRGLQIVDSLSDDWGVTEHETGKTVWVVVALDSAAQSSGGGTLTRLC